MARLHHKHWKPEAPGLETDLFTAAPICRSDGSVEFLPWPPAQKVDTSLAAAAKVAGHTARLREAVFQFIRVTGGATDGEIAQGLGMNPSTVRPRRRELQGDAPWCHGKLPARIERTLERRAGMRVYQALRG